MHERAHRDEGAQAADPDPGEEIQGFRRAAIRVVRPAGRAMQKRSLDRAPWHSAAGPAVAAAALAGARGGGGGHRSRAEIVTTHPADDRDDKAFDGVVREAVVAAVGLALSVTQLSLIGADLNAVPPTATLTPLRSRCTAVRSVAACSQGREEGSRSRRQPIIVGMRLMMREQRWERERPSLGDQVLAGGAGHAVPGHRSETAGSARLLRMLARLRDK